MFSTPIPIVLADKTNKANDYVKYATRRQQQTKKTS